MARTRGSQHQHAEGGPPDSPAGLLEALQVGFAVHAGDGVGIEAVGGAGADGHNDAAGDEA
jgi:hypothetical protein